MGSAGEVPKCVGEALERLRRDSPHYLALSNIRGNYYVYAQTSVREEGRVRTLSKYMGRITRDGEFLGYGGREKVVQDGKGSGAGHGNNIPEAQPPAAEFPDVDERREQRRQEEDETDRKILMALSMNGRITVPYMKGIMGISGINTYARIKRLEKELGIRYTAVIEPEKIGFDEYMAFIRFPGKRPSESEMKGAVERCPYVQFAMLVTGDCDMVLYFLAEKDADKKAQTIRRLHDAILERYDTAWYITPLYRTYGYVPLRERFFDEVLSKRVWHRTKESLAPQPGQITQREYAVLRELSIDGKMDLSDIDREYGFDEGRAQYTYHQLREREAIGRITIDMRNLPVRYNSAIVMKRTNAAAFASSRKDFLMHLMGDNSEITNRYSLVGDIHAPDGGVMMVPVFDEGKLEAVRGALEGIKGVKVNYSVGTSVILGSVCLRNYDNALHPMHEILKEEYKVDVNREIRDYEGAKRQEHRKLDIRGIPTEENYK